MIKRKRYSIEDDTVLIGYINKYPTNLRHAFECTAKDINRTIQSVDHRWYHHLRHKNIVISMLSPQVASLVNTKNINRNRHDIEKTNRQTEYHQLRHRIMIQRMMNCSTEAQRKIIQILKQDK